MEALPFFYTEYLDRGEYTVQSKFNKVQFKCGSVLNQTGQLAMSIFSLSPYLINMDGIKGDEGSI